MFPLEPWEQVVCTLPMMTRHDLPPKKRTVAQCFLEFYFLATPLSPLHILLHRTCHSGWAAALPSHVIRL